MDFRAKMNKYFVIAVLEMLILIVLSCFIHERESRRIVMLIMSAAGLFGGPYIYTLSTVAAEWVHSQHTDSIPIKIQIQKAVLLAYARVLIVFLANAMIIAAVDMLFQREDGTKMDRGAFVLLLLLPTIVYAAHRVRAAIAEVREIRNGSDDLK